MSCNWLYFPIVQQPTEKLMEVISVINAAHKHINSNSHNLSSDEVLARLASGFESIGFVVERSKKKGDKIEIPVLFKEQGIAEKVFLADAYHHEEGIVIEVEAGRGVTNYQFLKDFFEACMMVDVEYLCIAVRNTYKGNNDFEKVCTFFRTLYASNRVRTSLKGLLVVGY